MDNIDAELGVNQCSPQKSHTEEATVHETEDRGGACALVFRTAIRGQAFSILSLKKQSYVTAPALYNH